MDMLTMSHVRKAFGEKTVLRDLTLSVPEKTIFGFAGQNGAGKTTAMKIILGLLRAEAGDISVNGIPVSFPGGKTNRYIGYLPDVPEFYPYMTPEEYLRFCGEVSGMNAYDIRSRTHELLSLVGLDSERRQRIKGFSRGMKQRLGIAQALLNRPKLLICDEPTSALDPAGRKAILDILVSAKEHTTVFFSTHILSDVEHICDQLAFLHNGEIVLSGTLEQVKRVYCHSGFEIETDSTQSSEAIISYFPGTELAGPCRLLFKSRDKSELCTLMSFMAQKNIVPLRFEHLEPTLESLFMEVTEK